MAYRGQRMTGGLNLKAAADAIGEGELRVATACAFDEAGTLSSARGRQKANNDAVLNSTDDVLGGVDGLAQLAVGPPQTTTKYRFIKAAAQVYANTTTATALDESTNLTATYTTSLSTLVNARKGLSAPTWSATSTLSGFMYGGYTYLADGSAIQRVSTVGGAPPTLTKQAWGLVSPGYHEITTADKLSIATATDADLVKLTVDNGHGYGLGIADSPSYPYTMNVEFVGFRTIAGIPDNEINCLHYGGSGAAGDISVTTSGGLMSAGATYTVTYQNGAGSFDWSAINVQSPSGGAAGYSNTLQVSTTTHGSSTNSIDEVQTMSFQGGSASSGYGRLKFSRGGGDYQITANIAYNATAAEFQAAAEALSFFNAASASTTTCQVISATEITFETATDGTGGTIVGGGTAGFIRQGPTLTEAAGGALVGGTYYYAYAFFNGVAESNMSARVPIAVATGAKVTLSNVLMGPVGTTARRIYRTDVDGRQLYEVGSIDNNTVTEFVDTAKLPHGADFFSEPGDAVSDAEFPANEADEQASGSRASKRGTREAASAAKAKDEKLRQKLATNLGLQASWTDHDPPPSDLKEVGLIGDTVFGISGSSLCFSRSGEPEHFPLANRVTPGRNTSETLRQWLGFDGACIMYTSNALFRLSPISLDFGEVRYEEIESPVGLAGARAVAALDGTQGHVFLAKNGIYLFDGTRVVEISHKIEPMFTDSTNTHYVNPLYASSAIMVTSRDRLYMTYATTSSGNNRTLVGDFENPSDPKWTVLSWGFTSMWRERADNYVMAGDSSGYLYVLDTGYTDDGAAIAWAATTGEWRFNQQTMFRLDEIVLDADFAGATTTVTVTMRVRSTTRTASYTLTNSGRQRIVRKLPVWACCETVQCAISSSHAGQRKIYEIGFTSEAFEQEP